MKVGPLSSLVAGTAAAQAFALAALPLLTRLYTTEDFGVFGTVTAYFSICAVVACLRLDTAIVGARDDVQAAWLVHASLRIVALAAAAATAAIWAASLLLPLPALPPVAWLTVATMGWLAGVHAALRSRAIRERDYRGVAATTVGQSLLRVAVPVALGPVLPLGWAALALGEMLGRAGAIVQFVLRRRSAGAARDLPDGEARAAMPGVLGVLVRYREFVTFGSLSALIDTAGQHALVLISAALSGPAVAGPLVVAQRIAGAVFGLLAANVGDVWQGEAARLRDTAPHELARQVVRRLLQLLALGAAIFVPVAVVGHHASGLVFGAHWEAAGTLFACLTPMFVVSFAVNPLSRTLLVLERLRLKLLFDVCALLLPAAAYFAAQRAGGTVASMVLAFALANVVVYVGYFLLILRACIVLGRSPAGSGRPDTSVRDAAAADRVASK